MVLTWCPSQAQWVWVTEAAKQRAALSLPSLDEPAHPWAPGLLGDSVVLEQRNSAVLTLPPVRSSSNPHLCPWSHFSVWLWIAALGHDSA